VDARNWPEDGFGSWEGLHPTALDWLIAELPTGKGLGMVGFRSGKDGRGAGCGAMRGNEAG
jgi:hypothetical protein